VEGVGGPLTGLDPEESPLSVVQTVRGNPDAWEGRLCSRNEQYRGSTMMPKGGGFLTTDETSIPVGASLNRPIDAARRGSGRTHS